MESSERLRHYRKNAFKPLKIGKNINAEFKPNRKGQAWLTTCINPAPAAVGKNTSSAVREIPAVVQVRKPRFVPFGKIVVNPDWRNRACHGGSHPTDAGLNLCGVLPDGHILPRVEGYFLETAWDTRTSALPVAFQGIRWKFPTRTPEAWCWGRSNTPISWVLSPTGLGGPERCRGRAPLPAEVRLRQGWKALLHPGVRGQSPGDHGKTGPPF